METARADFYDLPKDQDSPGIRLGILITTCDAMYCIFNRCDSLVGSQYTDSKWFINVRGSPRKFT